MAMAIDEVVDDYENENRVDVKDGVVRNSALDCMELNYTTVGMAHIYENLTAYTEIDPDDRIIHYGDYNISATMKRNVDTRLYEDYGVAFFDVFEWEYEMYFNSSLGILASKIWFILSNYTTNPKTQMNNQRRYIAIVMTINAGPTQRIDVIEGKSDGLQNFLTSTDHAEDTWYYNTFKLNSTYWEVSVYTDSARTILKETISVVLDETKANYRYLMIASVNTGHTPELRGNIRNIWLGNTTGGYETDGYFTTTDFLDGLSYNATVLLTNTTIPSGSINAEISTDGSSWTDLGGLVIGYGAIDLRALGLTDSIIRYNYTRGDPNETPRLHQTRLVHEGPGDGVETVNVAPFLAIGIVLALAMILLADKTRR